LVLGLTGPNAAGKSEAAAYLATLGFRLHSLSDVVRAEAAARGLPAERGHLIRIGNELREKEGPGVLARRILPELGARDVVDSIRSPEEVAVLRQLPRFVLVGIRAEARTRFERAIARARPGDPRTLEEFLAREREENLEDPNRQQLDATFRLADFVVDNDGTLGNLHRALDRLVASLEATAPARDDRSG